MGSIALYFHGAHSHPFAARTGSENAKHWRGNTLKLGDEITVPLNRLREGGPGGFGQKVVLANGSVGFTFLQTAPL